MTALNVVPLPVADINDLPERLRALANRIEAGEEGYDFKSLAYVGIQTDGTPRPGGLGHCVNRHHAAGILQAGVVRLLEKP